MRFSIRRRVALFARVAEKMLRPYQVDATLKGIGLLEQGGFVLKILRFPAAPER